MKSVEVKIKGENYKIIRNGADDYTFSVFNHTTFHVIKKDDSGLWMAVEHRFGADNIPLNEIGEAIDKHYKPGPLDRIVNE